jgi:uroporphyrinogen-III synthase
MYLIFSSEDSAEYILERSSHLNMDIVYIPTMEIVVNTSGVAKLAKTVSDYDYVIITSAYAIKLADGFIKAATNPIFITSGEETAAKLTKLAINSTVMYPLKNSGSHAIIAEVLANLDLSHKKILIVRGELANAELNEYLEKLDDVTCHEVVVYQQKLLSIDANYLQKLFEENHLQGIIITSSLLTIHLVEQAKQGGYLPLLRQSKFITIHPNVRDILVQNEIINVHLTKQASLAAIIDKIKGLI